MDQDEAVLRAAPATFLDRKSKVSNLYYALSSPPEYPLSKALTSEQAKRILDASFRHNPEFVRFEDARYQSNGKPKGVVYYYFADSPYGNGRWAVKNQRVQFQRRRASNFPWKNVGDELFVVQAALASLENVAKRTGNELLASIVSGWVTTREVAGERAVSKREAKELDDAIIRFSKHKAFADDPKEALEYASLDYLSRKGMLSSDAERSRYSALVSRFMYAADQHRDALRRKLFRYEDIPRAAAAYNLDHPAVALLVGNTPLGSDVIVGPSSVLVYFDNSRDSVLQISILDRNGALDPLNATVGEARGAISPRMVSDATRVLRGYGFAYLVVPKALGHRDRLIEALREGGYVPFDDTHFALPPKPRANPRRRRR